MASSSTNESRPSQIFNKTKNLTSLVVNQSKEIGNVIKTGANFVGTKWKESSTVTKTCIIGSATAAVAPLAIIPALGMVGFTSAGVVAGSLATSIQTATTVSGSLFALCQSAGAVGAIATSTSAGVGLTAGATAGGVTALVCRKGRRDKKNDEEGQTVSKEEQYAEKSQDVQSGIDETSDALPMKSKI
jgi:hypothetical protein